ncbi:disease resistance protein PIK6-NP-like [Lolium rigidum]|uniref:disease resistance protein PIK6-NP-like n=1 Tax=Lolium rigidum TaxID=89674 RepID=UPI001F5C4140|nr:disease resistance protein PIK6-NP-like [Lolium rigidum]
MDLATGAMRSLLPKLLELLKEEYNLQTGVRADVESLSKELASMQAALHKVGQVQRDQLDELVNIWADEVRELSYNMEDVVDTFLVHVDGSVPSASSKSFKGLIKKMGNLFHKGKARREIADAIKDINKQVQEVANRRARYMVDNIVAKPASEAKPTYETTIDPRLRALYAVATDLVGIYGKRDQDLIKLLSDDDISNKKLKIVSIVGFGGLGKTTLVKAVYQKMKGDFGCSAFVPIGRDADAKKVFIEILIDLDKEKYTNYTLTVLNERQLIDELVVFLENKRYLIVIDDIWNENLWEFIKLAFSGGDNLGSRVITTTRIVSISKACCSYNDDLVYKMKPLSEEDSQALFYKRIFSQEDRCPPELEEVSRDILKKCGGVPLAIIAIASLLASNKQIKQKEEWYVLLSSIGTGITEGATMKEMQMILSVSYYDLPPHLKTCLLYLSAYPEDREILTGELIWRWIGEGFIHGETQDANLFEIGQSYFNELINRGMIEPTYYRSCEVFSFRVHDMVLDMIRSLSNQTNFVTLLNGTNDITYLRSNNVRRLSLQNIKEDQHHAQLLPVSSVTKMRSITICDTACINLILPALSSFRVLRVLNLIGFNDASGEQLDLSGIGNLVHLRYLGISGFPTCELPSEVGNLQFLQVLNVNGLQELAELPPDICKLRRLICLLVHINCISLPDGFGYNLTSIEVLARISASMDIAKELHNLARLRRLAIHWPETVTARMESEEVFVDALCNLDSIESVRITGSFESMDLLGECWAPTRHLQKFEFPGGRFSGLPTWIKRNTAHLSDLSYLHIEVKKLWQDEVQILGRLPALRRLYLHGARQPPGLMLIDGFHCTIYFSFVFESPGQLLFQRGALPRAEEVIFSSHATPKGGDGGDDNVDHFGLCNLMSLQKLDVTVHSAVRYRERRELQAALTHVLHAHRNHPIILYARLITEDSDDEDSCNEEE